MNALLQKETLTVFSDFVTEKTEEFGSTAS